MKPFDALFFDLGNTLMYFAGEWSQVFSQANIELMNQLKTDGIDIDEKAFFEEFGRRIHEYHNERESGHIEHTTSTILKTLLAEYGYPDFPEIATRRALKAMYSVSQDCWHPDPDALPTLQTLKERGFRLGLISNAADDQDVQTLVDKARLRPYFDRILSSASAGIRKPHPRIFYMVLDEWEIEPSRAAMIGDTLSADIQGANNAGLFSIWMTKYSNSPDNPHIDTIQPDATISTLRDLPELLESLSN
jgi:putative hydrolase of the HAD superfamily